MSHDPHIVVVGGGIAGLACAHALARSQDNGSCPRVTLLEAGERLGGKIRSESIAGRRIDVGAESLLTRIPAAIELCRELGLEGELMAPATMATSVWARKRLRELPAGILGGLPDGAGPVLRSGILSPLGIARASLDLLFPRFSTERDRPVADLIGGRLGRQALDRLVDPLLGTIYGAGCDTLSLRATAPQLEAIAREHRSLIKGMLAARAPAARAGTQPTARAGAQAQPQPAPPFATLPEGLERIVERLGDRLREAEQVDIRRGTRARLLVRIPQGRYAIGLADGERLAADGVVIAAPAFEAADILSSLAPGAAGELAAIDYLSTVVVTLSYPAQDASRPLRGSGLLVPGGERSLLGACTLLSNKWPHISAEGELWLRCSVARASVEWALGMDDAQLAERLARELRDMAGLTGAPLSAHVTRWRNALPHYVPGHLDRIARIEQHLKPFPEVTLAGAAYRGMGVPQCIAQGQAAAERILTATARSEGVVAQTR